METNEAVHEIVDAVGLDVWYVYEDRERHMAPEAVIIGFASALLTTYLTSFLRVEEIAARHRARFDEFVRQVREGRYDSNEAHAAVLAEMMPVLAAHAAEPGASERARGAVRDALVACGIPHSRSERHAQAVEAAAVCHYRLTP